MSDPWLQFYNEAKFIEPNITQAQAMYLWRKAKELCGFIGTLAEPARRKKWHCTTCGAFVDKVFFIPGRDYRTPWHWTDLHGEHTCGPCERTPTDEIPNEN